ncbi:caspase family protein [Nocardia takedensis]|uniref:caspase family protein n=1 Tax=Nocardia takedensis TaxID=259390 RepID=UPI003F76FC52
MPTESTSHVQPRRFLIAAAVTEHTYGPQWNRPGLRQARETVVRLFTETFGYTLVRTIGLNPTADQVRDELVRFCSSPDRRSSDIVVVYFTGHGERLDDTDEHVLYTADTDPADPRLAMTTAAMARAVLFRTPVRRFLLILDTCYSGKGGADFISAGLDKYTDHWDEPAGNGFVVVSSAQPHEFAEAGRFPRLLADAVQTLSATGYGSQTFAVQDVVAEINAPVLASRAGSQVVQANEVRLTGRAPAFLLNPRPGPHLPLRREILEDLRRRRLTLSHTRRAAAALDSLSEFLINIDVDGALSEVLDDPSAKTRDRHALVAQVFSTGRSNRLFELLSSRVRSPTQEFALLDLQDAWLRQETIASLAAHFNGLTTEQIHYAYFRAGCEPDVQTPANLSEALDHVGRYGAGIDGFAPLQRFLAALEQVTGMPIPDIEFGLADNELIALREDARSQREKPTRLVIEIPTAVVAARTAGHGAGGQNWPWPSHVEVHRREPGEHSGWETGRRPCEPTLEGVTAVVNELAAGVGDNSVLGFIVPRPVFDAIPEAWMYSTELDDPEPFWMRRPTILHCAERRLPNLNYNWRDKLTAIKRRAKNHGADLNWIELSHSRQIKIAVEESSATCFGIDFVPPVTAPKLSEDPLMAAIRAGAPYIVWTAHADDRWDEAKDHLVTCLLNGPIDEMPTRLHKWRRTCTHVAADHVRLIWDDPEILPPTLQLLGAPRKEQGE